MFIAILWTWTQLPEIKTDDRIVQQLPWLIKTDNQGGSSVLGLTLEQSTAKQAETIFNDEAEFALFQDEKDNYSLEAYFNSTRIAGLLARITLTLQATPDEIQHIIGEALDKKGQPSNSYKYKLPDELKPSLYLRTFDSMTYTPKVSIEPDVLKLRFGEPDSTRMIDEETTEWFYPKKGLLVIVSKEHKPAFIYVRPDRFQQHFSHPNSSGETDGKS